MASNEDCPTGVASNTFTVRVLPSPDPPVMGGDGNSYCGSGTITATAGDGGTGIRWDDGSTLTLRTVNAAGTYYAVTTSAAGCTSSTATISVTITLPGAAGNAATCGCIQGLNDCDGTCLASCCTNCANWTTCPGFSFVSSVSYENETLMSRMDAEAYCQSKGAKLPNSTMMNCMCENKETLPGGYEADLYWINGGYDSGWWRAYNMNTCGSVLQQPTSLYHVKCVGDGVW
jgi:hypothetical protein